MGGFPGRNGIAWTLKLMGGFPGGNGIGIGVCNGTGMIGIDIGDCNGTGIVGIAIGVCIGPRGCTKTKPGGGGKIGNVEGCSVLSPFGLKYGIV